MDNIANITSKDPDMVTDAEFEELKKALNITKQYLEILQRAYNRLKGRRLEYEFTPKTHRN